MNTRAQLKRLLLKCGGEKFYRHVQYRYWRRNLVRGAKNEPEIRALPQLVKAGDSVLDIGAHLGRYVFPLSQIVGATGKVFAVEPVQSSHALLQRLVEDLDLNNVSLFQSAFGDTATERWMEIPRDEAGVEIVSRSRLADKPTDASAQRVTVTTLDEFWRAQGKPQIRFIKCDVEGAELLVFKGGFELLTTLTPAVLCEIQEEHTRHFGYAPQDLVALMNGFGYSLHALKGDTIAPAQQVSTDQFNYFFLRR